jgi:uncharacterized DUF497 family protein
MNELSFDWDSNKAKSNEAKHGVSFDEAKTVFYDEAALIIPDPDHSEIEERFVIMGMSALRRVLVVVHCFRTNNSVIRIISARKAGTKEKQPYARGRI